ncbi:MAG TPA: response regulator transcription factor [Planctomycetota bacterium]
MSTRIVLAEDHLIVRDGLRAVLEREGFEVVAEASDGLEAVEHVKQLHPEVVVLDLSMPNMNGITAAGELHKVAPRTRIVLLTVYTERQYVIGALQAGVHAFVAKSQAARDLVQAIKLVMQGRTYLSPSISQTVVDACLDGSSAAPDPLSPRERQVLQLVAEGKTTKEAAWILGISVKTAESHRTRIMGKLDVHDTASLVRYAIRSGVVTPEA